MFKYQILYVFYTIHCTPLSFAMVFQCEACAERRRALSGSGRELGDGHACEVIYREPDGAVNKAPGPTGSGALCCLPLQGPGDSWINMSGSLLRSPSG